MAEHDPAIVSNAATIVRDGLESVTLPSLYWQLLAIMLPCYVILTKSARTWFYRRIDG